MTVTRAGTPRSARDRSRTRQSDRIGPSWLNSIASSRSETFQQADRLKRFLTFIVKEAVAGRGGELKDT